MNETHTPFSEISVSPDQLAGGLRFAELLLTQGRYKESQMLLQGLALIDPGNPYVHALLGSSLQHQNKIDEALDHYSQAILLFPEDINSYTNRGELYLKSGKLAEAAADLAKAVELDTTGNHPSAMRARLLASMTASAIELVDKKGIEALDQ
jgi:tetratricopeptide (TPR) repeat protein